MVAMALRASLAACLAWGLYGQVQAQTTALLTSQAAPMSEAVATTVPVTLTVAQMVERNAAARGGLEAWKKIRTMAWTGYAVAVNEPERKLPFLLEQQRPASTRFEIANAGQKAVRVFNEADGWKLRATSTSKPELKSFGEDELRFAQGAQVIDGPLMHWVERGASLALRGRDTWEGRPAWVLEIKTAEGDVHRLWLDAETFLEVRLDRSFRSSTGQTSVSQVLYRDYRMFDGLQMPVVVETVGSDNQAANRLVIERVALNPALDANTFVRPNLPVARRAGAVTVDTRAAAQTRLPQPLRPVGAP